MKKSSPPSVKSASSDLVQTNHLPRLVDGWLLNCDINRCTERTIGNRRELLGRLHWFLEHRKLLVCDTLALKQFFHYLNHGHKEAGGRWGNPRANRPTTPGTAATYHRHFRAFFNYLVTEGQIEKSPMDAVPTPINRPDQVQPLEDDQVQKFIQATSTTKHPKRDKTIVYMLLDCAMRVSELIALRIGDVDLNTCTVTINNGKGGKARFVPFSPETRKVLYEFLRERGQVSGDEFLFLSERGVTAGAALSRHGLALVIDRLAEAAGVTDAHPHKMRHTFSVGFLRNGGNQFTLMSILGHTSLAMTSNYVKVAQADMEKQHRQFSPISNLKGKNNKGR